MDLAMIGLESYEIDKLYQKEVGEPEPTLDAINGLFLKRNDFIFRIQTSLQLEENQYTLAAIETRRNHILRTNGLSMLDLKYSSNNSVLDRLSAAELEEFMTLNEALIPYENGEFVESDNHLELEDPSYQFVIRTDELTRFVESFKDDPVSAPQHDEQLGSKERNTLLALLGAAYIEMGIDPSDRGVTPAIRLMTEKADMTISENTIRKVLKQVSDIVS